MRLVLLCLTCLLYCVDARAKWHIALLATNTLSHQTFDALQGYLKAMRKNTWKNTAPPITLLLHAGRAVPYTLNQLKLLGYTAGTIDTVYNLTPLLHPSAPKPVPLLLCANFQGKAFRPYTLIQQQGLSLGIIGISAVQRLKALIKGSSMVTLLDPIEAYQTYETLISPQVDLVIGLSSLGAYPPPLTPPAAGPSDEFLATQAQKTTKIIVGVQDPHVWKRPQFIAGKMLIQAGTGLTRLDLFLSEEKKITDYRYSHHSDPTSLSPSL